MSSANRIITSGTALVLCPKIKQQFGFSAALVLQQLHYWLSKENISYGIIDEAGYQWIRNSYEQWCEQIQVLTLSTLRRAFSTLIEKNIILSQRFSEKSRYAGGNQVKFYTINYDQLEAVMGDLGKASINRPSHFPSQKHGAGNTSYRTTVHNSQSKRTISQQPSVQKQADNCSKQPNHLFKMNTLPAQNEHPLYITNTTPENTSKKTSLSRASEKIDSTKLQVVEVETIQPDKPAERDKINIVEDMISFWNEIIEQTPNKIALTAKRSQHLNAAFKQFFNSNLADWEAFCCKIASSKFLMGDVNGFKAYLDWSIRFETIQRILEGGYSFGDRASNYKQKLSENCVVVGDETFETTAKTFIPTKVESPKALAIRENIKKKISPAEYASWFLETEISVGENEDGHDEAVICVATRFKGDRIQTTYRDIFEQYFNAYFVGTAEHYLTLKNIHTTRSNTDMTSLNECQKNEGSSETCVALLQEECLEVTKESSSEEELLIEMSNNSFNEEARHFINGQTVENQPEKKTNLHEEITPQVTLMYEEPLFVVKRPVEKQKRIIPKTSRHFVNHPTSLNWFKNSEMNYKTGRGVITNYPIYSKQRFGTPNTTTFAKFNGDYPAEGGYKEKRERIKTAELFPPPKRSWILLSAIIDTRPHIKIKKHHENRIREKPILTADNAIVPSIFYADVRKDENAMNEIIKNERLYPLSFEHI